MRKFKVEEAELIICECGYMKLFCPLCEDWHVVTDLRVGPDDRIHFKPDCPRKHRISFPVDQFVRFPLFKDAIANRAVGLHHSHFQEAEED